MYGILYDIPGHILENPKITFWSITVGYHRENPIFFAEIGRDCDVWTKYHQD